MQALTRRILGIEIACLLSTDFDRFTIRNLGILYPG